MGQATIEDVRSQMEKLGIDAGDSTIYRDFEWLESQKLVSVTDVKEKGKRFYAAI